MTELLTDAEARRYLRLDSDDPYIAELSDTIVAARKHIEQYLSSTVVNATLTLTLDAFPAEIALPFGPVLSITSVVYVDNDGASQTLAADQYLLTSYPVCDVLTPAYSVAWPSTRKQRGAVVITYAAGMQSGSPLTIDDKDIIAGYKLVLQDLWDNRAAQHIGVSTSVNPTVERLLHFHRRNLGT